MFSNIFTKDANEVFYRGSKLVGFRVGTEEYSPERMLNVYRFYEICLKRKMYERARNFEKENKLPREWMNRIIYSLITEEKDEGDAETLIGEFKERGYTKDWMAFCNGKYKRHLEDS